MLQTKFNNGEQMAFIHGYAFQQWVVQFLVALFMVGGFAVAVAGVGLIVDSAGTLRFFAAMNRGMNLSLDNWVAASPRSAGWIITVAGLVLVVMWFGIL